VTSDDELSLTTLPEEHAEIDYLITSDFAEVINGKTYIMGAGWDRFTPPQYPALIRLGIAVGVRVPFLESNMPHHVTVVLRQEATEHFRMEGDLETGRRPGSRGESTLVPIAVNAQFQLLEPQTLELTADIDGRSLRRVTIRAEGRPQSPKIERR
jgi:hypothetical protein